MELKDKIRIIGERHKKNELNILALYRRLQVVTKSTAACGTIVMKKRAAESRLQMPRHRNKGIKILVNRIVLLSDMLVLGSQTEKWIETRPSSYRPLLYH